MRRRRTVFVLTEIVKIDQNLSRAVSKLNFSAPVAHVYNPLKYAWKPHLEYLNRYGSGKKRIVFIGMNPGPFGMGQTGVPFGEVGFVRDWMGIEAPVKKPENEHPKRPILGFKCMRSEVSGSRLWGWAKDRCGTAEKFFQSCFVLNYCPLIFLEETGRNRTPDKLPVAERQPLNDACDRALRKSIELFEPEFIVGVGAWATKRARAVLPEAEDKIHTVLHPSPASPKANRGWAKQADAELKAAGISF